MNSGVVRRRRLLLHKVSSLFLIFGLISLVGGKDFPHGAYAQSLMGTASGFDLVPSNSLAMPGGTGAPGRGPDSIYLSSGMLRDILPPIPNLEIGYLHTFGKRVGNNRLTLDYVLPVKLGSNGAVFGEAHGEFTNFLKNLTGSSGFAERSDVSLGGGYRRIFHDNLLLEVNAFYDGSRLGGRWYGSGSVGFAMASLLPGNDMVDLNFNYYGNLF